VSIDERRPPEGDPAASAENEGGVDHEEPQYLEVESGSTSRRIAFRRRAPAGGDQPGVFWLCGFKSEMASTKASAIDAHCARVGREFLRFDYSGHGLSGGAFKDGTISRWLAETLAVFRSQGEGPRIVVGSSMGGWLALLLARELARLGETARLAGMVLIAPAVDFTEALIWANASLEIRRVIMEDGAWRRPSACSEQPYVITRGLIEDGRRHLLLDGLIRAHAPTRILQGMRDVDVPYAHALRLVEHMASDPVTLTLVRDGEHRLSRPEDIALLCEAIEALS
jgi:pimeloyl-ACP methyl ester carboxylesterase